MDVHDHAKVLSKFQDKVLGRLEVFTRLEPLYRLLDEALQGAELRLGKLVLFFFVKAELFDIVAVDVG